ncbi:GNAT family N-acetyltransferase [Pseudomonas chlororaphis]|uniref:GNAT family N-acetyltransferase n=1 Tax=Pseudomonas chlororaphis TaxID=587753 RepID=UPI00046EEEB2|nr:N-acetyltransferase [Pseudomonas chlororaphis]
MINIREATIADLDVLRDVGCETYREHFSAIWSPTGMQSFLNQDFSPSTLGKSLESPDSHLWLMASNESGRVVGFSKVNWSTPAPLTGEVGVELQKIYFLKSAAGLGYGKQLLHFICNRAMQRGEHLLWLDVLKSNSNARRFYEAFGFQEIGEIPFKTDLAEIGMVVMACELSRLVGSISSPSGGLS